MTSHALRGARASPPPVGDFEFAAFLSYSHAADGRFAPELQKALHRFAKPWNRLRAVRVFRDDTTLSTTPGLWSAIERALVMSEHFVLLASPDSAASHWVAREVAFWCSSRGTDTLLIVLTEGELVWDDVHSDFDWNRTTALPDVLRELFSEEPRHVDFRPVAHRPERLDLRDETFRERVADLAATLHHRPKDELLGEDVRQHAQTRRLVRSTIAVLAALLTVAVLLGFTALAQRNEARDNARAATARLLAANSVLDDRLDRSLLLALGSWQLQPSPQGRGALLNGLVRSSQVVRVLQGHGRVDKVVFSPDGQLLAASGRDGTVELWDLSAGEPRGYAVLTGHDGPVRCLAFNSAGTVLASGGNDGRVVLWDVQRRVQLAPSLAGSSDPVRAVAFSPDGAALVASEDGLVRFWDTATGRQTGAPLVGHVGAVTTVAVAQDGRTVATGGADHTVRLWDLQRRSPIGQPIKAHGNWVAAVAFRPPDGSQLVSVGEDGRIAVWDGRSGRPVGSAIETGAGRLRDVAFSVDGSQLFSASEDRTVRRWDLDARRQLGSTLGSVGGPARTVSVRPQGDLIASGGDDATIVLWRADGASPMATPLQGPATNVVDVAVAEDARVLVTTQAGGAVRLWNLVTGLPISDLVLLRSAPHRPLLAAAAHGDILAVTTPVGVELWDVRRRSPVRVLQMSAAPTAVALTGDGQTLAAALPVPEPGSRVELWNTATGTRRGSALVADRRSINDLAFDPAGGRLAAATHDSAVVVWDVTTGQQLRMPPSTQAGQITAVAFVSDTAVASGADDGSVVMTDVAAGQVMGRRMAGQAGRVRSLAVDDQNGLLASGADDGTVVLWDIGEQARLGAVVTFQGQVSDITVGRDIGMLVSASPGGVVLTTTKIDVWRQTACNIANRDLSVSEWDASTGGAIEPQSVCPIPPAIPSGS